VCFLIFCLSWSTEILFGAESAFSDQKVEEHFFRRLKHSSICFVGVLATKWVINTPRVMSVASNLADGRRVQNSFKILAQIKSDNGAYDWNRMNYVYLLQIFNGTGGGIVLTIYYAFTRGIFTAESSSVRITFNWLIAYVGIYMIKNNLTGVLDPYLEMMNVEPNTLKLIQMY